MIKPEFEKQGSAEQHADSSGNNACRVFLVEDDADDQFLAKKRLKGSGKVSEVLCFSNGDELIGYMKAQGFQDHSVMCLKPTVIILDLNMPKLDGFAVLRQLKSDPFLQEIPVVVVSGNSSYDNVRRAHELKADAFFTKPINVYQLHTFLNQGWQWPRMEMWMH
ncbi:MAG: response regulator [Rhodospirillales bacterium]|nr:response regulator [Rhodospirillales bacterium]